MNNSRKTDAAVPAPVTAAAEAEQSISQSEVWILIKKPAFRLRQQDGSILRGKLALSGHAFMPNVCVDLANPAWLTGLYQ
jgi:hypothetical protein